MLLTLVYSLECRGAQVTEDSEIAGWQRRIVFVSPDKMTERTVELLFKQFRRDKPYGPVWHLTVLRDRAPEAEYLRMLPQPSLDGWSAAIARLNYEKLRGTPLSLAEVLSVKDIGGTMRFRHASGRMGRRVLWGRDPTVLELETGSSEVVYESYFVSYLPMSRTSQRHPLLYVVLDGHLDSAQLSILFRELLNRFGREVAAYFRKDGWFIGKPGYPPFNPFLSNGPMISPEEFSRTSTGYCFETSAGPRCSVQSEDGEVGLDPPPLPFTLDPLTKRRPDRGFTRLSR